VWLIRRAGSSLASAIEPFLFALVAVAVAAITTDAFLWSLGVPSARHLLPVMAAASLCVHVFSRILQRNSRRRLVNLLAVLALTATLAPPALRSSALRRTDCDLAAAAVAERADENDIAIVMRFTHSVTFQRYYHGAASWKSVPDVADHRQQRWDLARDAMMDPDSIREILSRIESALRSGHKVFLVGRFPRAESAAPVTLPPAPQSGWRLFAYQNNWDKQITYLLRIHAVETERVALGQTRSIDPREHEEVFAFSGWRD
jgi:hypothetical protein